MVTAECNRFETLQTKPTRDPRDRAKTVPMAKYLELRMASCVKNRRCTNLGRKAPSWTYVIAQRNDHDQPPAAPSEPRILSKKNDARTEPGSGVYRDRSIRARHPLRPNRKRLWSELPLARERLSLSCLRGVTKCLTLRTLHKTKPRQTARIKIGERST
jgi:hypothetical protein